MRWLRHAISVLALLSILVLVATFSRDNRFSRTRQSTTADPSHPLDETSEFCGRYGFEPYASGNPATRKVYDLFLISTELDWLEIRLHTLAPWVDYFVIVESFTTFTGLMKPLHFRDNWDRFAPFHSKIIYAVVEDPGSAAIGQLVWAHEDYMRNSLFNLTFPTLVATDREPHDGDVLIVSDIDEIPRPAAAEVLRRCAIPDRLTLQSDFYYYSFQWLHQGPPWPHPQATVFHGLADTIRPNDLRQGIGRSAPTAHAGWWTALFPAWQRWREKADLPHAAWHCSSCFATLDEMRTKMSSFSHMRLNTEQNRDEATMLDRVRNGRDLFGRKDELFWRVEGNTDLPPYVLENPTRFSYMLNRDGEGAGFTDWRPRDS